MKLAFAVVLCSAVWGANRAPLAPNAFDPLPLKSIRPTGWLERQLRIQADGLSGKLDEFWPSVGPDSGWLGGAGESWERGPYYLDGLVPLAFLLDDPTLIAKAHKWVRWTLEHQRPDGSIGPEKNQDWWPNMVMLKVLTQYQEATGDERVIPLMRAYVAHQLKNIEARPLKEWAIYRWQDEAVALIWLYNRTGDNNALELARALHKQGFDWKAHFLDFKYPDKVRGKENLVLKTHVVNNAMGLKTAGVWSQISRDAADRNAITEIYRVMDQYHGMPSGVHSGDEHYAGRSPVQGTELCAVVETMFSLEQLSAIGGDPALGDRLEKIAYNALPATFSKDMWAHQYDQQPNQVLSSLHRRDWTDNGPESNLFGLEPNFGCCTANFHQGWPKLAASLWMTSPDNGLAAIAYAPSEVTTTLNGVRVNVSEQTEYPFDETIQLTVRPERTLRFPLRLRIPAWAAGASVKVNGRNVGAVKTGAYHRIERAWKSGDRVEIRLPMQIRIVAGYNGAVSVERGPLVFALEVGEDWRKLKDRAPAADWEVHPTTAWNYGLITDVSKFKVDRAAIGKYPFSPEGAPVIITAPGRRVPEWQMLNGSAAPPPTPTASSEPVEPLTLIPYGAAKLRITAFPKFDK